MSEEELLKKHWKEQENLKPTKFYSEDYVKELQERIDKVIEDMNNVLSKYIYYEDYTVDSSIIDYWVEILKGVDKE